MPIATILRTPQLTLVPATAAHVRAELAGAGALAALLGADVPASWPPGEYDAGAQAFFLERLREGGEAAVGWYGWYAVRPAQGAAPATVVAGGGYLGPPSAGVVELGFSVCPEWRGRGYATELASALAAHAARQADVVQVIAHTANENRASIAVLGRSGFVAAGPGPEPGTVRFEFVPRSI